MESNLISRAILIVGLQQLAVACGVTHQAVRKWERNGCLPRTDWTGESNYASKIDAATAGAVTKKELLLMRRKP